MAKRRGRARKRRTGPPQQAATATTEPPRQPRASKRERVAANPKRVERDPGGVGERPQAPWHPWPFSELLILVGAIATIIGFTRGAGGQVVLFAGIGSVVLGTLEFTVREHLAGYRAHSSLIAAVPTALVHGGCALLLYELGAPRTTWVVVPLAIDVPLFWILFRLLKARFDDARRDRVFSLQRR